MIFKFQAKCRANKSKEEKDLANQKKKEKQIEKRANMSKEEKDAVKEKDRLRKRKKAQGKKILAKTSPYRMAKRIDDVDKVVPPKIPFNRSRERENDKAYRRRVRAGMTGAEVEYEQVYNLLKQRHARQSRDGKAHLLDNLKAKRGMRDLKEIGRVFAYMRRGKREKDEEVLWWRFWIKGQHYKDILTKKNPEIAARMSEKEEFLKKKQEDREKLEEELDARGRWVFDSDGEYYWSIPDENGHRKSLAQYEAELEENEPKLSPEEEEEKKRKDEEKRKKDREMWRKHDEQMEKWAEQEKIQKKEELAKKQRERRKKKKEDLLKPIQLPKPAEKSDYEKARDKNIQERYNAMKDSGMFSANELKRMQDMMM